MSKHSLEKGRAIEEALKGQVLEHCREKLAYDPLAGQFVRIRSAGGQPKGTVAGTLRPDGYVFIQIAGRQYFAHRLAWLVSYGDWPDGQIDHINRVRSDNRLCNLRVVTGSENSRNSPARGASGYPGVYWHKQKQKWVANICIDGKRHFLGYFDDPRDAHAAYLLAAETLNNKE